MLKYIGVKGHLNVKDITQKACDVNFKKDLFTFLKIDSNELQNSEFFRNMLIKMAFILVPTP